jgi:myo-inositol catabolism protein IolS
MDMKRAKLGNTEIEVSAVALGCWSFAGDSVWGPQNDVDSIATVHAALDAGINLFDTAEGYGDGRSERVLGKALAGRRDRAVIATKVSASNLAPDQIRASCEQSLRLLQTDYIDLYQIHWPSRTVPLEVSWRALEDLRKEGKVRAIGVCNFGPGDLGELMEIGQCATNQLPYSLLWRGVEYRVQQMCVDHDVGILCYSPLAQGLLTGKFGAPDEVPGGRARTRHFAKERSLTRHSESGHEAETFAAIARVREICQEINMPMAQVALAWVLCQPGVTSVLAGARGPSQIEQNAKASVLDLPVEIVQRLAGATDGLKEALGTNLDQYQSDSRFR